MNTYPGIAETSASDASRESQETLRRALELESIRQLTRGVSHEFNNLLQNIVASLELTRKLIGAGRIGETDKFIGKAIASAHRAAALNQRVVAFCHHQPLAPKRVSINGLIGDMRDVLQCVVTNSIKIDLVLADDLWPTYCDAFEAETAILRMVMNARDAMPEGGMITIQTSNQVIDSDGISSVDGDGVSSLVVAGPLPYVCVAVTDGVGRRKVIDDATDPFFPSRPTGQRVGLALGMIQQFARNYGGHAQIQSVVDGGTTVKLYLPRYVGEAPEGGAG
jgi:signal transduction histidine kinase